MLTALTDPGVYRLKDRINTNDKISQNNKVDLQEE
jgi:hypothetical protein